MRTTRRRPARTRESVVELEDMMNVGDATARDLRLLGICRPSDLAGKDPYTLYRQLCERTGARQDPCVLDVFISLVRFADGAPQRPWWHYTSERKRDYAAL